MESMSETSANLCPTASASSERWDARPGDGWITCRLCRQPKLPNIICSSNTTSWRLMKRASNNNLEMALFEPSKGLHRRCAKHAGICSRCLDTLFISYYHQQNWEIIIGGVQSHHRPVPLNPSWISPCGVEAASHPCAFLSHFPTKSRRMGATFTSRQSSTNTLHPMQTAPE